MIKMTTKWKELLFTNPEIEYSICKNQEPVWFINKNLLPKKGPFDLKYAVNPEKVEVVMKIAPHTTTDFKRFDNEVQFMKRPELENIVPKILDGPFINSIHICVGIEFLPYLNLEEQLAQGTEISKEDIMKLTEFLCDALGVMEKMNILHGRIEASHILISPLDSKYSYKLIGFSEARVLLPEESNKEDRLAAEALVMDVVRKNIKPDLDVEKLQKIEPELYLKIEKLLKLAVEKNIVQANTVSTEDINIVPESKAPSEKRPELGFFSSSEEIKSQKRNTTEKSTFEKPSPEILSSTVTPFTDDFIGYFQTFFKKRGVRIKVSTRSEMPIFEVLDRTQICPFMESLHITMNKREYFMKIVYYNKIPTQNIAHKIFSVLELITSLSKIPLVLEYNEIFFCEDKLVTIQNFCNGGNIKEYIMGLKEKGKGLSQKELDLISVNLAIGLFDILREGINLQQIFHENVFLILDPANNLINIKLTNFISDKELNSSGSSMYIAPEMSVGTVVIGKESRSIFEKSLSYFYGCLLFGLISLSVIVKQLRLFIIIGYF